MICVLSRLLEKESKGFIFTVDAIVCLGIAVTMTSALTLILNESTDLNDVYLYQYAQDIMEACSELEDLSEDCFDFLTKVVNPALDYCLNCEDNGKVSVVITRRYPQEITLRVWIANSRAS